MTVSRAFIILSVLYGVLRRRLWHSLPARSGVAAEGTAVNRLARRLGAAGERVYFMEIACALCWGTYLPEIAICGYVYNVYRVYFVVECMNAIH